MLDPWNGEPTASLHAWENMPDNCFQLFRRSTKKSCKSLKIQVKADDLRIYFLQSRTCGERLTRCLFSFRANNKSKNKSQPTAQHVMTDPLPWRRYNNYARESARLNSQTLQTYILQTAHKKRESFQSCSRVCLFFSHSEVQVPQGYPAPQVRPPWAISEADPTCKGLTCFSKTQNERKVPVNFTAYDDRPPSLKQKPQLCTRKCQAQ